MKYIERQITFQEVPNEASLSFLISGCPNRCKWCHSSFSWDWSKWVELNRDELLNNLDKNWEYITCVLFLWGEWEEDNLIELLDIVKDWWLKTCLYSGLNDVPERLKVKLDYLKLWPYIEKLWGLNSPDTNQRFIRVSDWEDLTYLFKR